MLTRTFLITALFAAPAWCQAPLDSNTADMARQALSDFKAPSVSVAVVEDGRIGAGAFGKADLGRDIPATVNTRYAVGSISKQFTAAALLLLVEGGKLSLDDKVAKWFPDLTRASEVTVRQLLSHTSGYSDYAPQDYIIPEWTRPTTPEALIRQWAAKPLDFDPGTKWQYSNTNFVLAGLIFEKAAGVRLKDFLQAKFFGPLRMTSAGYCDANGAQDAHPYTRFALGPPRPVAREGEGWYFADGDLCMTAADLARWDLAFIQHKILPARAAEEWVREIMLPNGDRTGYALGLSVGAFHHVPAVAHSGEVSGFLASNEVFPTRGKAVVVLSNEDGVGLYSTLAEKIATAMVLPPADASPDTTAAEAKAMLTGLQNGTVDRAKLTSNCGAYFTPESLADIRDSLAKLGALKAVTRTSQSLRGGMVHRVYRADFDAKSLTLNIYVLPDGKYEQFMVEE